MSELREWAWQQYNKAARSVPNTDYARATWRVHLAASGTREVIMTGAVTKKRLVVATGLMDTDAFVKHFSLRHADSLAGLTELPPDIDYAQEQLYRSFHWRIHDTRVGLTHEHEPDPPEIGVERAILGLMESTRRGWHEIAGINGFVAIFPGVDNDIATRVNGIVKHHRTIEEAADRLISQSKPVRGRHHE